MPRSGAEARRRLQGAALELWSERGYDATTAADIAARAGVTERTFFRHFPDKREVLFDGAAVLRDVMVAALAATPPNLAPFDTLKRTFNATEPLLKANLVYAAVRQRIIAATPDLQERELAKRGLLVSTLADALQHRGLQSRPALLAAGAGLAAFEHAYATWIDDPEPGLNVHLDQAFDELNALSASPHNRAERRGCSENSG